MKKKNAGGAWKRGKLGVDRFARNAAMVMGNVGWERASMSRE